MLFKNLARKFLYKVYEHLLTKAIKSGVIPHHIAIIMDGNRRFADRIKKPRYVGHIYGADTTEKVLDWCWEIGVKHLTVYAFSTENFNRPQQEREHLFDLLKLKLEELYTDKRTHERKMCVRIIGETNLFPSDLQSIIKKVENATKNYNKIYLNIALAYGGRREIADAVRAIAEKVKKGVLSVKDINENTIAKYLYPINNIAIPKVDLIIRTGGEMRTSNFLPWQANGNECAAYFCAPYWPEFRKIDFLRSIRVYQRRCLCHITVLPKLWSSE